MFSFVAAASIGLFFLVPALALVAAAARLAPARWNAYGALAGAGVMSLVVAWIQRGAGDLDARPWLIAGCIACAGAFALAVRTR